MDVKHYAPQQSTFELEDLRSSNQPGYSLQYKISPSREICHLLHYRSAYGSYGIFCDPVGSVQLNTPKPFHWLGIFGFSAFPAKAFCIELSICPFRCNSRTALVSYSTGRFGTHNDLLIYVSDKEGITVEINEKKIVTHCFPDYSQWQDLAVSWDSESGNLTIHNDDRDESILNVLQKGSTSPKINCLFEGKLAQGEAILGGGVLLIGQQQTEAGNIQRLVANGGMVGAVKRLRIWDHVRTAKQLSEHKSAHIVSSDLPGLVGDWGVTAASLKQQEALNFSGKRTACLSVGNTQLNDPAFYRLGVFIGRKCYYSMRHFSFNQSAQLTVSMLKKACIIRLNDELLDLREETSVIDPELLKTGLHIGEWVSKCNVDQIRKI